MNKKDLLKGIIISIVTLIAGYGAMAIPFNIFLTVSKDGQRIFFLAELCIYLVIGSIFLLIQDKKEKQAKKQKARHEERAQKIKDVQQNWYDIAA
ncbi:hypothetical protein [uncultured Eubacterium sp.]|uniref:hypothetical protein n=1 Tax=uncultured Eubacterium sp. TaxID=165185 RepID=UPI0025FA6138|nr:hypothetical protein [uncultured Eubacterium sp.]